ncbi:hypothetical protein, partial [Mesomycoplasma ovipneumoniae]|uniref:hypothetical protein n=1 Tax=Mesomycoplasma ovipneumoniae TaxID=29562 RepID=UPI003080E550
YIVKNMSVTDISKHFDCSTAWISKNIKEFKLKPDVSSERLYIPIDDLTPIKYLGLKGQTNWYLCQCSCGVQISVSSSGLTNKHIRSCGCKNRFSGKNHGLYKGYEEISSSLWSSMKLGARLRNLEFSITLKDVWNMFIKQNRKCSLTGLEIVFAKNRKQMSTTTSSLDRIDSTKGYT